MYLVGLTGGIGSGKSEAARIFTELGVPVVDTDAIAHRLTAPGETLLAKVIEQFGTDYLQADRSLNRAALRDRIFADSSSRKQLEAILHPAIYETVLEDIDQHPRAPYQIVAIPLLFESERYQKLIDRSLLIDCDEHLQVSRAAVRSHLAPEAIAAIMQAQMPRAERVRRADDIITNNGSLVELRSKIEDIHKSYMQACIVSQ